MLATLGVASLLVWLVPMVFLSRRQAELVSSVAPPSVDPAGEATRPVSEGSAPTDPIGRARDLQAQALLNGAIRVAQVWWAENGTFSGFGPGEATEYDPSIYFTSGVPAPGTVTMRVTPDEVAMVTVAEGGGYLCAAANLDLVTLGRVDAARAQDCYGGW